MKNSKIEHAAEFAKAAHEGVNQRRKYTNEPYIVHPQLVAKIVASVTDDEDMICAAWLHDVVEDTPITLDEIRNQFGDHVATMVDGLTNVAKPEDGNRATRVAIDQKHTAAADSRTKTIKLADLIANLTGIVDQDPRFAKKYLAEKTQLLEVLGDGDKNLMQRVREVIRQEMLKLEETS